MASRGLISYVTANRPNGVKPLPKSLLFWEARFHEDTEVIDFFAPPRDDFLHSGKPAYMREGRTRSAR
jgi:hypothetical protein